MIAGVSGSVLPTSPFRSRGIGPGSAEPTPQQQPQQEPLAQPAPLWTNPLPWQAQLSSNRPSLAQVDHGETCVFSCGLCRAKPKPPFQTSTKRGQAHAPTDTAAPGAAPLARPRQGRAIEAPAAHQLGRAAAALPRVRRIADDPESSPQHQPGGMPHTPWCQGRGRLSSLAPSLGRRCPGYNQVP